MVINWHFLIIIIMWEIAQYKFINNSFINAFIQEWSLFLYRPDVLKITYSRKKFFVELRPSLVSLWTNSLILYFFVKFAIYQNILHYAYRTVCTGTLFSTLHLKHILVIKHTYSLLSGHIWTYFSTILYSIKIVIKHTLLISAYVLPVEIYTLLCVYTYR